MIIVSNSEYDRIVKEGFKSLVKLLHEGGKDEDLRVALERSWRNYMEHFERIMETYPYVRQLADEVRRIKESSIDRLEELVDETIKNIEHHGGQAYLARDASEANKIVEDIIRDAKLVVKSKSMTTEEIWLREHLESLGVKVVETDIGEFIIQMLGSKPMHTVAPSLHVRREQVAEMIKEKLGKYVDEDDIPAMVNAIREHLRENYFKAEVGITGANVISANTGSIFIIENEGNARLTSGAPRKHVVVAGVEKIVPTLIDAFKTVEVTMRYAGYDMATYINVISGPSKTGDIEKMAVPGAQGPKELHVILLDNGRIEASKDPVFKEALYCLKCGACTYVCPTYRIYGGLWGGRVYVGGIGVAWTAITESLEAAYVQSLLCGLIGRCKVQCPMKIDIPGLVREVRRRIHSKIDASLS